MNTLYSLISAILLFAPTVTTAQGLGNAGPNLDKVAGKANVTDKGDLGAVVGSGIAITLQLVGLIFLVLMVYAGILWMTARGEDSQIDKAKKIIFGSIIGLIIVVSAYAITALVTGRLGS